MSTYEYIYTREIVEGAYNIDNPKTADEEGFLVHLSDYVAPSMGGKAFLLVCAGAQAKFIFMVELSAEEESTLSDLVVSYKALTGQ